jgi:hypothetical protein
MQQARHTDLPPSGAGAPAVSSPIEMANTLRDTREALRGFETTALAGVAATLAQAAESLAQTAQDLHEMQREEWMTADQAASYLGRSKKSFERIAPHLPRSYVSRQDILYPRSLIDEALYAATSPEGAIVNCRHAEKSRRAARGGGGTGAARSLRKALEKG